VEEKKKIVGFFYTPKQPDEHRLTLKAMFRGVSSREKCFIKYDSEYEWCDVSVNWGIYKQHLPHTETRQVIHDWQEINGNKAIVIESGYIKRDKYYSVGYGGLNGRADFNNKDCPPDRWKDLGLDLKDYRGQGEHILLCGQVPWDAAVQHIDYNKWCLDVVDEIKSVTDRPIIFRPHPKFSVGNVFTNVKTSNNARLIDDLRNCWAAVALSSNALVESVIEGVPVFACDKGAMSLDVSNDIIDLENPKLYNREQWAYNLAYTQWTREEMVEGLPWKHLT
jgi:hypothetical protein